jgi:hypothetical protein
MQDAKRDDPRVAEDRTTIRRFCYALVAKVITVLLAVGLSQAGVGMPVAQLQPSGRHIASQLPHPHQNPCYALPTKQLIGALGVPTKLVATEIDGEQCKYLAQDSIYGIRTVAFTLQISGPMKVGTADGQYNKFKAIDQGSTGALVNFTTPKLSLGYVSPYYVGNNTFSGSTSIACVVNEHGLSYFLVFTDNGSSMDTSTLRRVLVRIHIRLS